MNCIVWIEYVWIYINLFKILFHIYAILSACMREIYLNSMYNLGGNRLFLIWLFNFLYYTFFFFLLLLKMCLYFNQSFLNLSVILNYFYL